MPVLRSIARVRPPSASAFASIAAVAAVAAVVVLLASHRPAAAQSGADEPYAPGARETFIPTLRSLEEFGPPCFPRIIVQNVGNEPSKGVAVFWGDARAVDPSGPRRGPGPGPIKVECTGLIAPGTAWHLTGPMIPAGAQSAIIYSATTKLLSEIDVDPGFDDIVADIFCETLIFAIIGDERDALRLRQSVREGGDFDGLPMDRVLGAPLAVIVDRECHDDFTRYSGISNTDGLSDIGADAVFEYVSPSFHTAPSPLGSAGVAVMNVGFKDAAVELFARPHRLECPLRTLCGAILVAPGETATIPRELMGCPDVYGSAWISSDQPLAVVVDGFDRGGRTSTVARRMSVSGLGSGPGSGVGAPRADALVDQVSAPLVYIYRQWSTVVHVANTLNEEVSARLSIRDRSGNLTSHHDFPLCPLGSHSLYLNNGPSGTLPDFIGSISIDAVSPVISGAGRDALAATVELVRYDGRQLSVAAYEVIPAEPGDGLFGVPLLVRGAEGEPSSRLAIQNRARLPGFTDFVVYIFDSHGLVDYLCLKLNALEMEYIDFSTSPYLSPGFKGSALISAVYWEHEALDERGDFVSNVVSLGVVALDVPKESLGAAPEHSPVPAGASMYPALDLDSGIGHLALPVCESFPGPVREIPVRTTWHAYLPNVAQAPSH